MATEFKDQGGAATSNPSPPLRWAMSMMLRRMADPHRVMAGRAKWEGKRRRAGRAHIVEYFHQVDDGYSHLAAQLLQGFLRTYDVRLVCHLVPGPGGRNAPEPDLLSDLSRYDSANIAPHYGLTFPEHAVRPEPALVDLATRILASLTLQPEAFATVSPLVGEALWSASMSSMQSLAERYPPVEDTRARALVAAGAEHRAALGHYSSAMFYYGKEWYWGVDRLDHLENRLADLGVRKAPVDALVDRPAVEAGPARDDGSLTLEIYPSLRSPYTAVVFDKAVELARTTGVGLVVRPVLPMVMRGVPATRAKGVYIFSDASREARAQGQTDWGKVYDPIGEPVRRCYSLYPWAAGRGRGIELLSAFMRAAFREGVNTNNDAGLRHVVESAGLSWTEAQDVVDNDAWQDEIEANRLAMYEFGLWGVPSFRLLDAAGETLLRVWGQDRLWLVAREIQRRQT